MIRKFVSGILMLLIAASAAAQSLCWEISGNKLRQSSYLFGTMHSADNRIFNFTQSCLDAFDSSEVYTMEIDPEKVNPMTLLADLMGDGKRSLKKELNPADYALLDSMVMAKTGMPLEMFDKMQPIVIEIIVAANTEGTEKNASGKFLDMHLHDKAVKAGKKIGGVETIGEQLKALNSLDYNDQVTLLLKELKDPGNSDKEFEHMIKHYINAELDSLLEMSDEAQMPPQFMKVLLTDRNYRMADRIAGFIQKDRNFIAIGALHLPGEQGVIELLRKKGFTVTALK